VREGAFLGGSFKWFLPASASRVGAAGGVVPAERDRSVDLGRF
jgi:hypothetical protein